MKKWSEEESLIVVELIKKGDSYLNISKQLNRTPKSIKEKLSKLGYKLSDYYIKNNNYCLNCGCEIEKFGLKFCSQSCSATYNNQIRPKKVIGVGKHEKINKRKRDEYQLRKQQKCFNCGKTTTYKFCDSKCQSEYHRNKIFELIDNGDTTLNFRQYKKYLINKYGNKCMNCGWGEINQYSGNVPIELEHIDGDSNNNSLENLKLLCPNCHSLTPTYKALNIGKGRHKRRERYKDGKSY